MDFNTLQKDSKDRIKGLEIELKEEYGGEGGLFDRISNLKKAACDSGSVDSEQLNTINSDIAKALNEINVAKKNYKVFLGIIGHILNTDSGYLSNPRNPTTYEITEDDLLNNCQENYMPLSEERFPCTRIELVSPQGLAIDLSGNLYIADSGDSRIIRISESDGSTSTVAGNGTAGYSGDNGLATSASLNNPSDIVVDSTGGIYIADTNNNHIRYVRPDGIIETVVGQQATNISKRVNLNRPMGLVLDMDGNLLIADRGNNVVRRSYMAGGVETIAGNGTAGYSGDNGPATSATLNRPMGIALDSTGRIYIADSQNNCVRMVDLSGNITTIGRQFFLRPFGVAVMPNGNIIVADTNMNRICMIDSLGNISTIASVEAPSGIVITSRGSIICSSPLINTIDIIDSSGNIRNIVGSCTSGGRRKKSRKVKKSRKLRKSKKVKKSRK